MTLFVHHGSDLFTYDQQATSAQVLLSGDDAHTRVEYDEYVVYSRRPATPSLEGEPAEERHSDTHVTHRFSQNDSSGAHMLDLAFRNGFMVDRNGDFRVPEPHEEGMEDFHGRVRRVICFRRTSPIEGAPDMLSLSETDLADLDLHPATLQYSTRLGTECRFWSRDRTMLSLILSFSDSAKTPCDFLSMTYNVLTRSATILIRQTWEPRRDRLDDLDEYDHRLESCRDQWAHPLVMPVILLQVQFMRCEEAVQENSLDVVALEQEVSSTLSTDGFEASDPKIRSRLGNGGDGVKAWGPMNMTNLMKRAHEVLRDTIKLLDTIRCMERAVKLLIISGDELAERMEGSTAPPPTRDLNMGGDEFGSYERDPSPLPFLSVPEGGRWPRARSALGMADELGLHWHEIRQYLEGLLRLTMSLETERRMADSRCRAQIDIIYSRMAQEDNALNARMAVASSRDSAAMKALAVITAIFLPGEFIGTLFGMSMFDWLAPSKDEEDGGSGGGKKTVGGGDESDNILSRNFWVYWIISIPLTLFIILVWRLWWVTQDRYFRRHLSQELSEERFWTADGNPRELEHSFIHDIFWLSSRREESRSTRARPRSERPPYVSVNGNHDKWGDTLQRTQRRASTVRQRQLLQGRQQSTQNRPVVV